MLRLKISSLLLASALVAMVSCKKDDEDNEDRKKLLVGEWVDLTFTMNGIDVTNEFIDECDQDNIIEFQEDGVLLNKVGEILCDEGDIDDSGSWNFVDGHKKIRIAFDDDDDATEWNIDKLTDTQLKASAQDDGMDLTVVITLTAK